MKCPNCQAPLEEDSNFCIHCGKSLKTDSMNTNETRSDEAVLEPVSSIEKLEKSEESMKKEDAENSVKKKSETKKIYKNDTQVLAPALKPLSLWESILMVIVLLLPVINIIFLLIWAFKKEIHPSKQNLSRAFLIVLFVALIIAVITGVHLLPTTTPI